MGALSKRDIIFLAKTKIKIYPTLKFHKIDFNYVIFDFKITFLPHLLSHVENITEPLTGTGNTEIQKPDQNTVAIDISSSTPKCDSEFENTNLAIELSDTFKDYGSGKSRLPVLIGLNMNVVRGQIYGLLGKSLEFPLF